MPPNSHGATLASVSKLAPNTDSSELAAAVTSLTPISAQKNSSGGVAATIRRSARLVYRAAAAAPSRKVMPASAVQPSQDAPSKPIVKTVTMSSTAPRPVRITGLSSRTCDRAAALGTGVREGTGLVLDREFRPEVGSPGCEAGCQRGLTAPPRSSVPARGCACWPSCHPCRDTTASPRCAADTARPSATCAPRPPPVGLHSHLAASLVPGAWKSGDSARRLRDTRPPSCFAIWPRHCGVLRAAQRPGGGVPSRPWW